MSPTDNPPLRSAYALSTDESARLRFPLVQSHSIPADARSGGCRVTVALPRSWEKAKRRRYPLVLMPDGAHVLGSAIEMSRVLAATREVRECIVVSHDDPLLAPEEAVLQVARLARIVAWCHEHLRVERGEVALFAAGRALPCARLMASGDAPIDRWIGVQRAGPMMPPIVPRRTAATRGPAVAWTTNVDPDRVTFPDDLRARVALKVLPEATPEGLVVPAFVHGLRSFWGTGHAYGGEVMALSQPFLSGALCKLRPLIAALRGPVAKATPVQQGERFLVRSAILDRNFEVFVSLPRGFANARRRYPAVIALDANSTFSNVAETAARMAASHEIEDLIVIGVGGPRAEGDMAFGLRRFEELSPPCDAAGFRNPLGRFFEGAFALFGVDVSTRFGRAPQFHRFLCEELLPELQRSLPLDMDRLCLVGHSAAGTYVGYSLAQHPTPFSSHAALSPGVAISDHWMLAPGGGLSRRALTSRVLVTIGGEERTNRFNQLAGIPLAERYAKELGVATSAPIEFQCLEGETHTTVYPRALALALERNFGRAADATTEMETT